MEGPPLLQTTHLFVNPLSGGACPLSVSCLGDKVKTEGFQDQHHHTSPQNRSPDQSAGVSWLRVSLAQGSQRNAGEATWPILFAPR